MNDATRRAVAYVVGCLISGSSSRSVYDYGDSRYHNFSGDVSETGVSVYDYTRSKHMSGSAESLYDYATGRHISLMSTGLRSAAMSTPLRGISRAR
jgi:hypothetical protein